MTTLDTFDTYSLSPIECNSHCPECSKTHLRQEIKPCVIQGMDMIHTNIVIQNNM